MLNSIIHFTKKSFPKLYERLRTSPKAHQTLAYLTLSRTLLSKDTRRYPFFCYHTFRHYILRIREDVTFVFHGHTITMPNHLRGLDGCIEVWTDDFYGRIVDSESVLDLGGYIGDSALRLAENNRRVTVYEAHPENFSYLERNTAESTNIEARHFAVVGTRDTTRISFYGGGFDMAAETGNISKKGSPLEVPAKYIIDILRETRFDALKMDIEGAEYECIDAMMRYPEVFGFKKGFIEFHLGEERAKRLEKANHFARWLSERGYTIELFDAITNTPISGFDTIATPVFLLYFSHA